MNKPLVVLSLFDGIAGARQALQRVGFTNVIYRASEIDVAAMIVAKSRYPDIQYVGDIAQLNPEDFKDTDLVCGGSPCQSISSAGNRKGITTKAGKKIETLKQYLELKKIQIESGVKWEDFFNMSALYWEYVRMYRGIKEYNPNVKFFLENVVDRSKEKTWKNLITESMGVEPCRVNSNCMSAQNRNRDYWTDLKHPKFVDKGITLDKIEPEAIAGAGIRGVPQKGWEFDPSNPKNKKHKGKLTVRKDRKSNCVVCNPSTTGLIKYNNGDIKPITPELAELLQTVEAGYTNIEGITAKQRFHMLGNGWTIDVIAKFFESIPKIIKVE